MLDDGKPVSVAAHSVPLNCDCKDQNNELGFLEFDPLTVIQSCGWFFAEKAMSNSTLQSKENRGNWDTSKRTRDLSPKKLRFIANVSICQLYEVDGTVSSCQSRLAEHAFPSHPSDWNSNLHGWGPFHGSRMRKNLPGIGQSQMLKIHDTILLSGYHPSMVFCGVGGN